MKMYGIFLIFFLSVVSLSAMKKSKLQYQESGGFVTIEQRIEKLQQDLAMLTKSHELNSQLISDDDAHEIHKDQLTSDDVHEIRQELSWLYGISETNKVKARIQKDLDRLSCIPHGLQSQK